MRCASLHGEPNPKQQEFFKATGRHIAYGGARGGGKSWAMRRKFVLLASKYPGLRLLLLRRTFPELEGNHILPLRKELYGYAKYTESKRVFTFPNGSIIKLGFCDTESDAFQYQGQEYEVIGFEEATQFTESQMQFITTCNRSTRTDFTPRIYYTCNPGGPGHNYIKRLFIDKEYRDGENPDDYTFIQARVYDNAALMENDPGYLNVLKALPPNKRRAHLDGDWDVVDGQYFEEFNRSVHVVDPFIIPQDWKRFRAMDWGYNDPCAVLWFAINGDRRIYVYREMYVTKMNASDVASTIIKLSGKERISYTVASPDMWQKRGIKDVLGGESVAETFMKCGVPLIKADNSRLAGWQRVRENLAKAADGLPYLQIFSACRNLLRTLPALYYDEHDHEDVSDRCEDHAPEALRYGLMSRPSPATKREMARSRARVLAFDPLSDNVPQHVAGFFDL